MPDNTRMLDRVVAELHVIEALRRYLAERRSGSVTLQVDQGYVVAAEQVTRLQRERQP